MHDNRLCRQSTVVAILTSDHYFKPNIDVDKDLQSVSDNFGYLCAVSSCLHKSSELHCNETISRANISKVSLKYKQFVQRDHG